MSLFKKGTSFEVDYTSLEKRIVVPIIKLNNTKSVNGKKILINIQDICNEVIQSKKEPKNSFLVFGMILGFQSNDKRSDQIWSDCWKLYGGKPGIDNPELFKFLSKVLGTILMIQVCKDDGIWEFEPDSEKDRKVSLNEKPDAAIYNLRVNRLCT